MTTPIVENVLQKQYDIDGKFWSRADADLTGVNGLYFKRKVKF